MTNKNETNEEWWDGMPYINDTIEWRHDIPSIIAEAERRERDKWLTKLRQCLAEMPVAGNGRRLLMQLIEEMERM
jgi:hypothetical protein